MNPSEADDRIVAALAPAHSSINAKHGQAKAALFESLAHEATLPQRKSKSAIPFRYIVGSLGLSAAVTVAVALWLFSGTSPATAMEQMAKALDQVNGYTYRMEKVYVSRKGEGRTVRQITLGSWRTSPAALRATIHVGEIVGTNPTAPGVAKALVELEESHQANQGGIIIDHLKRQYWRVNENMDARSIPADSPQVAVHMVQQRRGRVIKDLGMKMLQGQEARGFEIVLDNSQPVSELGPTSPDVKEGEPAEIDWRNTKFEVWTNPKTNLPIEFRCVRRGVDFETVYCFHNLDWNVEFPVDAFDLVAPSDYTELDKSAYDRKQ